MCEWRLVTRPNTTATRATNIGTRYRYCQSIGLCPWRSYSFLVCLLRLAWPFFEEDSKIRQWKRRTVITRQKSWGVGRVKTGKAEFAGQRLRCATPSYALVSTLRFICRCSFESWLDASYLHCQSSWWDGLELTFWSPTVGCLCDCASSLVGLNGGRCQDKSLFPWNVPTVRYCLLESESFKLSWSGTNSTWKGTLNDMLIERRWTTIMDTTS